MSSLQIVKHLSGHSGCAVDLCRDGEEIFVRKSSGSEEYSRRLKKQFIKQKKFSLSTVQTPQILKYGTDKDGIFWFDMEFVNGITLAEYMHSIKVKEIVDLMKVLFSSLMIKDGKVNHRANELFGAKINSLKKKLETENPLLKQAFSKLENFDFKQIPQTHCCGDLTLENIILAPTRKIYLIDLLDSFYNSWMVDVAKLLQDIDLGWSYRHIKRDYNLNLRLGIAKQALIEDILQLENGKALLRNIYYVLLLNVLRIYPYTHDEETMNFLNEATEKVLNTIESMED